MGAHHVVDHRDLVAEVRALAPDGIDAFSAYTAGNIDAYAELLRPFGDIVTIDDDHPDAYPLKSKAISWHWEYMFARSTHQARDIAARGCYLEEAARLVDAGILRTTATTFIHDFTAEGLTRAHTIVESSSAVGKVVVHR